jgi:hypothetical protein
VKNEKAYMPSNLNANGSKLYLLSFNRLENGMPDFESFRNMCDLYHVLSSHGKIRSASAINGVLRDAISKMEGAFRFVPNEKSAKILDDSFCGILLESYLHPKNAILLGSVELIPKKENDESCETDSVIKDGLEDIAQQNDTALTIEMSNDTSEQHDKEESLEQFAENTQKNIEENSQIC